MKEELIRIENGCVRDGKSLEKIFLEISRGECIGIFSDNQVSSGQLLRLFRGQEQMSSGKLYLYGERTALEHMGRLSAAHILILEKPRHFSPELSVWDYLVAFRGKMGRREKKEALRRFHSPESEEIRERLEIDFQWKDKLSKLPPLSFCRLFLFKAWFYQFDILVLAYITEMLRGDDIKKVMEYTGQLRRQGMAFWLLDHRQEFLFRYSDRIDVVKNGRTGYRLCPAEYEDRVLKQILWDRERDQFKRRNENRPSRESGTKKDVPVLEFENVTTEYIRDLSFRIFPGEISMILDRDYRTAGEIQSLFLGKTGWKKGSVRIGGAPCRPKDLPAMLGKQIGLQLENPAKRDRTLFYQMNGVENLSTVLIPKAGGRLIRGKLRESILKEAEPWFSREEMLTGLEEWSPVQRLRLSYYKWYLVRPRVLICLSPFSGTDFWMHRVTMDMLSVCAGRGMGILIVSPDIEGIYGERDDKIFINRIENTGEN